MGEDLKEKSGSLPLEAAERETSESGSDSGDADGLLTDEGSATAASDLADREKKPTGRRLSISFRGLTVGALVAAILGCFGVMSWLYVGALHKLDRLTSQAESRKHVEQIAFDYASGAAGINYDDIETWKQKLVAGTTPELKEKLVKAAISMEQILVPLQWSSTAQPITAKVRSEADGVYVVDSFVSVLTKTLQAPQPLQSTAVYSLTIDSTKDWRITDVGGVGAALDHP